MITPTLIFAPPEQLISTHLFESLGPPPTHWLLGWLGTALTEVEPAGLDICSGLRTDGALDEEKLRLFMEALPLQSGRIFSL
jgi:hypothetical protein